MNIPRPVSASLGGTGQSSLSSLPLITPNITTGLYDSNGKAILLLTPNVNAVNYVKIQNSVSGSGPFVQSAGTDTNVSLKITTQGTGLLDLYPGADSTSAIQIRKSNNTTVILDVDSTNNRVGIGNSTPGTALDVTGTITSTGQIVNGNLSLGAAGNKISITTGSNASVGTGTLSGGTVTISTTAVTSSSLIFLTDTASSLTNVGTLSVTSKTAGTSFTVQSTNVLDVSTFNWLIIN